jgi:protein SCO1
MRWGFTVALGMVLVAGPAAANLSSNELGAIAAEPSASAVIPPGLKYNADNGQALTLTRALDGVPGVVIFADYTCRTLCGPILEFAATGLAKSGLRPEADYRVIVIGLDPKDGPDAARSMRTTHFSAGDAIARATLFLTGDAAAIADATSALGYRYRYDAVHDQFAHPAAVYITDKNGRVTRVLSGLGLDGADLRLALVEAGQGAVGTLGDRIRLLCYGYDPAQGIYTERITFALELAAGATLIVLVAGLWMLQSVARKRAAS